MLLTALLLLFGLIALSVPIAATLGVLGISMSEFFTTMPMYKAIGEMAWS